MYVLHPFLSFLCMHIIPTSTPVIPFLLIPLTKFILSGRSYRSAAKWFPAVRCCLALLSATQCFCPSLCPGPAMHVLIFPVAASRQYFSLPFDTRRNFLPLWGFFPRSDLSKVFLFLGGSGRVERHQFNRRLFCLLRLFKMKL